MKWRGTAVAPSGTHHVRDGIPFYEERFDEVLKFHEPGLAAVRRDGRAWHIRSDGEPAYNRRFDRAFGFYDGLAAAVAPDGWRHVRPDGTDLYDARYTWCGNFQDGRCGVREPGGAYLHLTIEGVPAYDARWRYAGDFRDGIAVVQSGDGRSTHIDPQGAEIHSAWFLDLDVFHKGLARARDEDGWMHVDATGRPLYRRRFAAVEPFYNGQARVERLDGSLEVIDETGASIVELRPALKSEFAALSDDLTGFWRTQAICAALELGIFEALPTTSAGLARACGLEPDRARRLLRALALLRLVEDEDGVWRATGRGAFLAAGHPWTLADAAVEYGRYFPGMWEMLPRALRADEGWRPPDIFGEVAADPARVASHHRMLASYALHDYGPVPDALGLRGDERVIDAGGGLGALAALLVEAHPQLRVTVLDRPEVVERARCVPQSDYVTFQAGDIFEPWGIEGDVVMLARVLHDWDDAPALRLLQQARRALPSAGRLFAVETVLPEDGAVAGLCDLHLLAVTGGKERTASGYAALLERAGFTFEGVRQLPTLPSIVVGLAK
ncbi:MAG: methyltransferase [Rhodospirillales bacterium]|nr:methyltransferase [Rhodospirillales bacterium]